MTSNSSLRKRNPKTQSTKPREDNAANPEPQTRQRVTFSFSDGIRILTTLLALTLSLSYYLTSGDSLTFHHRPWFTRLDRLKAYARGPLLLTGTQLSLYNGSNPHLPILLSLNRTLFDVSSSPHTYGPGGSYHIFAGRDATRAFVTGCFDDKDGGLSGDLRGVERLYVPVEDVEDEGEGERAMTKGPKKIRAEQEKREARKMVHREVEKWVRFYSGHARYFEVGRLVDEDLGVGGGEGEAVPGLCEAAERARPKRSQLNMNTNAGNSGGKAVFRPRKGDAEEVGAQGKPV